MSRSMPWESKPERSTRSAWPSSRSMPRPDVAVRRLHQPVGVEHDRVAAPQQPADRGVRRVGDQAEGRALGGHRRPAPGAGGELHRGRVARAAHLDGTGARGRPRGGSRSRSPRPSPAGSGSRWPRSRKRSGGIAASSPPNAPDSWRARTPAWAPLPDTSTTAISRRVAVAGPGGDDEVARERRAPGRAQDHLGVPVPGQPREVADPHDPVAQLDQHRLAARARDAERRTPEGDHQEDEADHEDQRVGDHQPGRQLGLTGHARARRRPGSPRRTTAAGAGPASRSPSGEREQDHARRQPLAARSRWPRRRARLKLISSRNGPVSDSSSPRAQTRQRRRRRRRDARGPRVQRSWGGSFERSATGRGRTTHCRARERNARWQCPHQKRFRPPSTSARTGVPHTRHGWPGAPVDVHLAAVTVAARRAAHRLRRVLGADGVDPAGAHALGHQLDEIGPQRRPLAAAQRPARPEGVDPLPEEHLGAVDVARPRPRPPGRAAGRRSGGCCRRDPRPRPAPGRRRRAAGRVRASP